MNLPLNARMHGLANYTPGGATRTDAGIERAAMRREGVNTIVSPRLSARVYFFPFFSLFHISHITDRTRACVSVCVRAARVRGGRVRSDLFS